MLAATRDPDGRRVVLTDDRWAHIEQRHPDVAPHLGEVMRAIREPDRRAEGRTSCRGAVPGSPTASHLPGGLSGSRLWAERADRAAKSAFRHGRSRHLAWGGLAC
jgi:hypothetical protein